MEFSAYDIALIPMIVALVGFARGFGLPSRWQPALALVLGLAGGFVYLSPDDPKKAILQGVVMGLSAVGLWSGVKNTVQSKPSDYL